MSPRTKDSELSIEKEFRQITNNFRMAGATAFGMLLAGATFFHYVQKLNWLDAFYFCTVSLTTVGYGDITPTSPAAKIFMMFYIVIGIGILATFANLVVRKAVLRREMRHTSRNK